MQQSIDMYFVVFDACPLFNDIHNLSEIPHPVLLSSNSFLIFIIKFLLTKGGLPLFVVYPLILPILYHCIFYTICRPMLLIYVTLVLQIRYAACLLVHVLQEESFLLHQHHVLPCIHCLVLWISNSVLNYSNTVS